MKRNSRLGLFVRMPRTLFKSISWLRTIAPYILFGVACSLLVNTPTFIAFFRGMFSLSTLGAQPTGSIDELYYAALIQKVSQGYFSLGNVSLFEHRFAVSVVGYAPLLQGLFMRLFGLSLTTSILLGDVFAPCVAAVLMLLIFRKIGFRGFAAVLAAFLLFFLKGDSWLRLMSPQITGPIFLLGLLGIFITHPSGRVIRAFCTASLFFVQPVYAVYFLAVEGMLFLYDLRVRQWKSLFKAYASFALIVFVAICIRILLTYASADPLAVADTYRRLGLTPTHLPAAPLLQMKILGVLCLHVFALWKNSSRERSDVLVIPILLLSSLLVLWQSVFTGVDGNFGLYYTFPIVFILTIVVLRDLAIFFQPRTQVAILFLGAVVVGTALSSRLLDRMKHPPISTLQMEHSLQALLAPNEPVRVIAAPLEISNMIPALSKDFVLFSQYARFQYASDRELARRYVVQNALFPLDSSLLLEGDPLIFGLYAGNLSARTRTWCKLIHVFSGTQHECNQKLEDFIYHQDVFRSAKEAKPDLLQELAAFSVSRIVTDKPLPAALQSSCSLLSTVDSYSLYDCDFGLPDSRI